MSEPSVRTHRYLLAGLCVVSEFPLPGLPPWSERYGSADQVVVRRSSLAGYPLAPMRDVPENGSKKQFSLNVPGIVRFLIRGGREILVDQVAGSDDGDVVVYLLGSAFGVLCHQRGIVPLHASAIDVAGGCAAFVGDSGAGKSTLIAALAARGCQVISDDVCFLDTERAEGICAWPGARHIRLWDDALGALKPDEPGIKRELRGVNKYLVPVQQPPNPERPRRLCAIYQLQKGGAGEPIVIEPVQGAATMALVLRNVYRLEYADHIGLAPAIFARCAPLIQQVPAFRFIRPLGFDALQDGVDTLLEHLNRSGP